MYQPACGLLVYSAGGGYGERVGTQKSVVGRTYQYTQMTLLHINLSALTSNSSGTSIKMNRCPAKRSCFKNVVHNSAGHFCPKSAEALASKNNKIDSYVSVTFHLLDGLCFFKM
jgi:hypothetical protein